MYRKKKNGETLRSRDTTAQHEINKNKKHFRGINFFLHVGTNKRWSVFGKGTKYGVVR